MGELWILPEQSPGRQFRLTFVSQQTGAVVRWIFRSKLRGDVLERFFQRTEGLADVEQWSHQYLAAKQVAWIGRAKQEWEICRQGEAVAQQALSALVERALQEAETEKEVWDALWFCGRLDNCEWFFPLAARLWPDALDELHCRLLQEEEGFCGAFLEYLGRSEEEAPEEEEGARRFSRSEERRRALSDVRRRERYGRELASEGDEESVEAHRAALWLKEALFDLPSEEEKRRAFRWLERREMYPYAWYVLGLCYAAGVGTERNLEAAEKYFQRCVECGSSADWPEVARLYVEERKCAEARLLLEKAARVGQGLIALSDCYRFGIGGGIDLERADALIHKALEAPYMPLQGLPYELLEQASGRSYAPREAEVRLFDGIDPPAAAGPFPPRRGRGVEGPVPPLNRPTGLLEGEVYAVETEADRRAGGKGLS
jgi:hypothetical protein